MGSYRRIVVKSVDSLQRELNRYALKKSKIEYKNGGIDRKEGMPLLHWVDIEISPQD